MIKSILIRSVFLLYDNSMKSLLTSNKQPKELKQH